MELIERALVAEALDNAGLDEDAIRTGYSGRGMYGEMCFGVVVPGFNQAARFLVELATLMVDHDEPGTAGELADAMRSDNMGMDMIFYFPGWELTYDE